MSDLLTIGTSGLLAYQSALNYTGNNIANVKTDFYSRRQVMFAENVYGQGVNVADVQRIYDSSASNNLLNATSLFALNTTYYQQLAQLEASLGTDTNNIGEYLKQSLTQLIGLNHDGSLIDNRTSYLNMLMTVTNRMNGVANQISQQQMDLNTSITSTVSQVNLITQQIASLNYQISSAGNNDISALLDAREASVQELSQYLNFTTLNDSNNQLTLMVNNGSILVSQNFAATMQTEINPADPDNVLITMSTQSTGSINITNLISGGTIGGYYDTQTQLQQTKNALGRLALTFQDALNTQNKLGMDLNGNLGGDIFNDINSSNLVNARVLPNSNNTGSANMTVNITDTNQLTTSDYKLVFTSPTQYTLTRLSDNTVMSTGTVTSLPQQISADGFSISINSGTIDAGDQFIISPTRNAAVSMDVTMTQPEQLALAFPVNTTANLTNQGNGKINVVSIVDTTNSAFSIPQQLNPPITVQFLSPTSYQLIDANTNALIEGPIAYDPTTGADLFPTPGSYDPGYRVHISGANIQTGDAFNIGYNMNGTGGNENGQLMAGLYTQKLMQNSGLTFVGGYDLLSSSVSLQTNSAKIQYNSSQILYNQASDQYDQVSGVSLEEESTYLAQYQEAYQACAQVIAVAKSLFDAILGIAGGV